MLDCAARDPVHASCTGVLCRGVSPLRSIAGNKPRLSMITPGVDGLEPHRAPGGAGSDQLPRYTGKWRSPRHLRGPPPPHGPANSLTSHRDAATSWQQPARFERPGELRRCGRSPVFLRIVGAAAQPPSATQRTQRRRRGVTAVPGDWARPIAGPAATSPEGARAWQRAKGGSLRRQPTPRRSERRREQHQRTSTERGAAQTNPHPRPAASRMRRTARARKDASQNRPLQTALAAGFSVASVLAAGAADLTHRDALALSSRGCLAQSWCRLCGACGPGRGPGTVPPAGRDRCPGETP